MKQSFSWWCFDNRGVEDDTLLSKAHEIGYEGVELLPQTLFQKALDYGLTIVSHEGHKSQTEGMNDPAQHERIEDEIYAGLELASKYKIPSLIVFSGSRRPHLSEEAGAADTASILSRVAEAAEAANITLLLELLNSKVDHPGYEADHTAWGVDVIKQVGSTHVKLLYDIYHMQIMEGDLIRTIRDNHTSIGHYHTAGNPGRNEITSERQEINYGAVFETIRKTGYEGYIGHEFIPTGDLIAGLQAAYDLCAES